MRYSASGSIIPIATYEIPSCPQFHSADLLRVMLPEAVRPLLILRATKMGNNDARDGRGADDYTVGSR